MNYPVGSSSRDLRIDYLRGLIMAGLVILHMEFYSLFSMFAWGRVGLVSTAEGFVTFSGIVIGMVYGARMDREGFYPAAIKLWQRAFQLYRVNLFIILSIALLYLVPAINTHDLMTWRAVSGGETFWLYPDPSAPLIEWLRQALLLKSGPHQFQVIGLYVLLVALAPGALWLGKRGYTLMLLIISWGLYAFYTYHPLRISGARFEYGFPILAWQVLFFNGMAIGLHRDKLKSLFTAARRKLLLMIAAAGSLVFLFIASNNPAPIFWPGKLLSMIPADDFRWLYSVFFQKTTLGIGRLINNLCLYVLAYLLLSHYWTFFNKWFGWFLIPIGQASLYVFILHIYAILIVSNTGLLNYGNFWINSVMHFSALILIWWLVKNRIAYRWIPR